MTMTSYCRAAMATPMTGCCSVRGLRWLHGSGDHAEGTEAGPRRGRESRPTARFAALRLRRRSTGGLPGGARGAQRPGGHRPLHGAPAAPVRSRAESWGASGEWLLRARRAHGTCGRPFLEAARDPERLAIAEVDAAHRRDPRAGRQPGARLGGRCMGRSRRNNRRRRTSRSRVACANASCPNRSSRSSAVLSRHPKGGASSASSRPPRWAVHECRPSCRPSRGGHAGHHAASSRAVRRDGVCRAGRGCQPAPASRCARNRPQSAIHAIAIPART